MLEGRRPRRLHRHGLQLPDARRVLQVRGVRRPAAPVAPPGRRRARTDCLRRGAERRGPPSGARLVRRHRPHRPVRADEPPGDARRHGSMATYPLRHLDLRVGRRPDDPRGRRRGRFSSSRSTGRRGSRKAAGRCGSPSGFCVLPASRVRRSRASKRPYAGFIRGSVELFGALRKSGLGLLGEAPGRPRRSWRSIRATPGRMGRAKASEEEPAGRAACALRHPARARPRAAHRMRRHHPRSARRGCRRVPRYLWATGNAREFGDPPVWDAEAGCIREGIIVSV